MAAILLFSARVDMTDMLSTGREPYPFTLASRPPRLHGPALIGHKNSNQASCEQCRPDHMSVCEKGDKRRQRRGGDKRAKGGKGGEGLGATIVDLSRVGGEKHKRHSYDTSVAVA